MVRNVDWTSVISIIFSNQNMSYFNSSYLGNHRIFWLIAIIFLFANFKLFNRHFFDPLHVHGLITLKKLRSFRKLIEVSFKDKPFLNMLRIQLRNFGLTISLQLGRDIIVRLNYDNLLAFLFLFGLINRFLQRNLGHRSPIIWLILLLTLLRFDRRLLPPNEFTRGFIFVCEHFPLGLHLLQHIFLLFLSLGMVLLFILLRFGILVFGVGFINLMLTFMIRWILRDCAWVILLNALFNEILPILLVQDLTDALFSIEQLQNFIVGWLFDVVTVDSFRMQRLIDHEILFQQLQLFGSYCGVLVLAHEIGLIAIPFHNLNSQPSLSMLFGLNVNEDSLKDNRVIDHYVLHELYVLVEVLLICFEVLNVKHILHFFELQRFHRLRVRVFMHTWWFEPK